MELRLVCLTTDPKRASAFCEKIGITLEVFFYVQIVFLRHSKCKIESRSGGNQNFVASANFQAVTLTLRTSGP